MYSPEKREKKHQEAFEFGQLSEREKIWIKDLYNNQVYSTPDIARGNQKLLRDLPQMTSILRARQGWNPNKLRFISQHITGRQSSNTGNNHQITGK